MVRSGTGVPDPWRTAETVTLDTRTLSDPKRTEAVIDRLHRAWVARVPHVVAWDIADDALQDEETTRSDPWRLGADFLFPLERLRFLCFTNNYDARNGEPRWWWVAKGRHIGLVPGGSGDALLPDGVAVWVDGGPRQPLPVLDLPVIHGETVEQGRTDVLPAPPSLDAGNGAAGSLAADQSAAVGHLVGPARIIAPAGSGKTRTLTSRVRHLLDGHRIESRLVTAVAYNERAAAEMRDRLSVGKDLARTIHSLGWEILRDARPGLDLIDERQVRELLDRLLTVPRRANADPFGAYLEALSQVRSRLRDPAEVEASRDDVAGFGDAFDAFRRRLYAQGAVDHGEQIYGAIEVLLGDAALRRRWQRRCRHLLVDEFQDLTPAYVLLLRLLASPELNVFGVGDDDQVIYGYDGADPGFLIDFDRRFPGSAAYALEVNYRCPPAVVDAAVNLLGYNRRRIDKTITAGRPKGKAPAMRVETCPGGELAVVCADEVEAWIAAGESPESIVVLTRVNSSLIPVKAALAELDIPTNDLVSESSLQRTTVAALLAWLRIGTNPERIGRGDLLDAVRRPGRGLTGRARQLIPMRRMTIEEVGDLTDQLSGRHAQRWDEFVTDLRLVIDACTKGNAELAITVLIDRVGLAESARALDSGRGNAAKSGHLDDLVAIQRAAAVHPDIGDFVPWLRRAVGRPSDAAGVTLSSVHRVKGMEWRRVIVFGADRGTMPHDLAEDLEEERRVLHVAITRATEETLVLADADRPSRFLAELAGSAPKPTARPDTARQGRTKLGRTVVTDRPSSRRAKPVARVGDTVRLWGGVSGTVIGGDGEDLVVRLDTGAEMQARPGDVVEVIPTALPEASEPDTALVAALKAWRLETARERNVPAYVVLNDRTVDEIARRRPANESELGAINGIGPTKLETFGDDILSLVAAAETTAEAP